MVTDSRPKRQASLDKRAEEERDRLLKLLRQGLGDLAARRVVTDEGAERRAQAAVERGAARWKG